MDSAIRRLARLLRPSATALLIAALLVGAAPGRADTGGVLARHGDKLTASIESGDTDHFAVELSEGGSLGVKLKAAKGSSLTPDIRVFRPDGSELTSLLIKKPGTSKPVLKKVQPAAGETGTWQVRINDEGGGTGAYTATFQIKLPKKTKQKGVVVPAAGTTTVGFTATAGALVSVTIKEKDGPELAGARVLDPDGAEVAAVTTALTRKGAKLLAKKVPVSGRFGRYAVELSGAPDAPTTADVTVVVKVPKIAKRKVTLAPEATLATVSPTAVGQEDVGVTVRLTGSGFLAGDGVAAEVSGDGVTVTQVNVRSGTGVDITLSVDADAAFGSRDVTFCPPPLLGEPVTLAGALTVEAPTPTIAAVSPTSLDQSTGPTTVTVTGSGFRTGGTLAFAGDGLTVGATTYMNATTVQADVTVSGTATPGARDVTFTHAPGGGGASVTEMDALEVHSAAPTLSDVSPATIDQGDSGTFTLTGTNLTPLGAVTVSGTGIALSNPTFVSSTTFTVDYVAAVDATTSSRDVTFTQDDSEGGAGITLDDAITVDTAGVQLTTIAPAGLMPGDVRVPVELTGLSYNPGTTVAISGSGITIHSTTVNGTTGISLVLSVASGTAIGQRDVTITPGAGGLPQQVFTNRFTVLPAPPTVASFSHGSLAQGAASVAVSIGGTNFRPGDTPSAGGSGVTFSGVSVPSAYEMTANATVAAGATLGLRELTVSHAASEGGAGADLADAFKVVSATPTITSLNPSAVARTGTGGATRDLPVTITGTSFMTGATLAVSKSGGSGVTVKSGTTEVVSDTSLEATLSITGAATTGTWDLLVTNPGGLGTSGATGNGLLDIKSESTLTVNAVRPSSGSARGGERVTIHGGGFVARANVDFGTVRAHGTQVIDQNTIVTTVPQPASTSATAATSVNVKVTNPSSSNATLTDGYDYAKDDTTLFVSRVFPPHATTGVAQNLVRVAVLLSGPADTTTGSYGPSTSNGALWFASGGSAVTGGGRSFSGDKRWFVFTRSAGTLTASTRHIISLHKSLKSLAGAALTPVRINSVNVDQYDFTTGTGTDTTAPTLSTSTPAASATGVSPTTAITLVFGEELDPLTVNSTNITFKQGSTTIAAEHAISDDLKTVTITPEAELATSTSYTTQITTSVKDLAGNTVSSVSRSFTTGTGTDTTAPTIDAVVFESLRSDMDGSGTWVNSSGSSVAYDLFLPRSGWQVEVRYSDGGGAGIDSSTFSAQASVAVGGNGANAELASNFDVTSTRAVWRVPSGTAFSTGENVTFSFLIKDTAGSPNTSVTKVVTFDVADKNATVVAGAGGDHDPFDGRRTWILRDDLDEYAFTYVSNPSTFTGRGLTTTASSNSTPDFDESLRLVGLQSGSMTAAAAATTNGSLTGTNAIVHRLFMERLREILRERYEIEEDGTRDADSVDVEFLLRGEQGSLASLPTYSAANDSNSGKPFSEMSIGGTLGADNSATGSFSTLGQAYFDSRNLDEEANLNDPTPPVNMFTTGVYLAGMFEARAFSTTGPFYERVLSALVSEHGGTAVGEDASDDDVLDGAFDRTASGNATHNSRYDAIMDAIEICALYCSATTAHECGHAHGLVPDGAPKTGCFGAAHATNTFTEATAGANTTHHLDYLGNDIMAASGSYLDDIQVGSNFARFNPYLLAWLRGRLLHDEGR